MLRHGDWEPPAASERIGAREAACLLLNKGERLAGRWDSWVTICEGGSFGVAGDRAPDPKETPSTGLPPAGTTRAQQGDDELLASTMEACHGNFHPFVILTHFRKLSELVCLLWSFSFSRKPGYRSSA